MIRGRLIRGTARPRRAALLVVMVAVACASPMAPPPDAPSRAESQPRDPLGLEPCLRTLVHEGAALWRRPPSTENTIACAACHVGADELRGWAASFPKVKPMPPPFTRVMTLQQAVAESVATHYRIAAPRELQETARAMAAYLAWAGEGRPLTPGLAPGQPVLPARLAALQESVERGRARVERSCTRCHPDRAAFIQAAATFPRVAAGERVMFTLEEYLERHAGLPWRSADAADVVAFLAHLARGEILRPGEASPSLDPGATAKPAAERDARAEQPATAESAISGCAADSRKGP